MLLCDIKREILNFLTFEDNHKSIICPFDRKKKLRTSILYNLDLISEDTRNNKLEKVFELYALI